MVIDRCGQAKQHLQQPVHRGCVKEIQTAHDMRHALQRIVDDVLEVAPAAQPFGAVIEAVRDLGWTHEVLRASVMKRGGMAAGARRPFCTAAASRA